ncbi:MAG: aminopeptidase [Actinobacteria bacterium]|nr:aminopeptidase [Actinomycetota bacterium]
MLILSDHERWIEGQALAAQIMAVGGKPMLLDLTPDANEYYTYFRRPQLSPIVVAAMAAADFTLAATDNEFAHMIGHTDENRAAQNQGMRWISIEDYMWMWESPMDEIERFIARTHAITDKLAEASTVRITTRLGTDIVARTEPGRPPLAFVPRGGRKGEIVPNFGESTIAPAEWQTEGTMVVDGIIVGLGEMREDPITCSVTGGRIVEIRGGANAKRFEQFIEDAGENADAIAEMAIATSHLQRRAYEYIGRPAHRAYGGWGSAHVAVGHNTTIGGEIRSAIHVDCQIYDATYEIDGVAVTEEGRYLV